MSSDVRKIVDSNSPYGRTLKYSIEEKLTIISHAKNHGNRAAGREYNVAESSIREWRKNETKLIHNKNNAAAIVPSSPAPLPSMPTGSSPTSNLNNNKTFTNNNNNYNQNKNGNIIQQSPPIQLPQNIQSGGIFGASNGNNGNQQQRTHQDLVKLQLMQIAMMNMDFTHLAQLAPLFQLQHQRQMQAAAAAALQQNIPPPPPPETTSTSSSVVGTPSSTSSSSTPPPSLSPVQSGSGRRKPKCPQKIVASSDAESPEDTAELHQ